jgi:hypothetical protein
VVNTMHFESDDFGLSVNGDGLANRIVAFYQAIGPLGFSSTLAGTGKVELYEFDDPKPRVPVITQIFNHGKRSSGLPAEVALCLSFRGSLTSGGTPSRRRGRIFLGPLSSEISTAIQPNVDYRPSETFLTATINAANTMARGASGTYRLAIYSPTTTAQGGSMDTAWTDADFFWMDDAFDTIRSRGSKATRRWTRTIGAVADAVQAQ